MTSVFVNYTEKEYIEFESNSLERHELINGELIEKPYADALCSSVAGNLLFILKRELRNTSHNVFKSTLKLRTPDESIYLYPNIFISNEPVSKEKYVFTSATFAAEVVSNPISLAKTLEYSIYYKKFPELHYYIVIEPVKKVVALFSKNEQRLEFFREDEQINLPALNVSFKLADLNE